MLCWYKKGVRAAIINSLNKNRNTPLLFCFAVNELTLIHHTVVLNYPITNVKHNGRTDVLYVHAYILYHLLVLSREW